MVCYGQGYLDDILVTGTSDTDRICNLDEVLKRLQAAGCCLQETSAYFVPSSRIHGHLIDKKGLNPMQVKVQAILKAPASRNLTQQKPFQDFSKVQQAFFNLSTKLNPLYSLFQKIHSWHWGSHVAKSFQEAKEFTNSIYNINIPNKECVIYITNDS